MKIFILTVGTRGDVQPYVALGKGLQAAGHTVTICTSASFEPFITEHGLAYAYMNDDIIRFIDSEAARKAMDEADNVVSWVKIAVQLTADLKPVYRRMLDEAWTAVQGSDAIIYHPKALGGYHIAEKLGIPGFLSIPFPVYVPTAEFPAVVFPEWQIGGWYNKLTYTLATRMSQATMGSTVNAWRKEMLHMPKRSSLASELVWSDGQNVPVLHCYSPHVLAQPHDWPQTAVTTGYWFVDRQEDWQPPADLVDFIAAGKPPVYVGFGSISGRNPEKTTRAILDALAQSGQRGILATGWGGLQASDLPDTVFPVKAVPHDWLFPQMAAVVHHGGAGTTAAGFRAGVPTVVCPFFGDQPYWGRRVAALGVGSEPVPQKKLTAERLARAIETAVTDPQIRQRAATLGEKIRAEDGVARAVAMIEKYTN
jgi:sterol 3beta-glucosyltransferase